VRRGGLWAKHMGLNWGTIGNTLGEHIGNLGNYWEPDGNLKGTCWEQRKNEKTSRDPSPPKLKRKKSMHFECKLNLPLASFFCFCSNGPFWLSYNQIKLKLGRFHKLAVSMWGWIAFPLSHLYKWEGQNFGQNKMG
jgi:hypothetical protein